MLPQVSETALASAADVPAVTGDPRLQRLITKPSNVPDKVRPDTQSQATQPDNSNDREELSREELEDYERYLKITAEQVEPALQPSSFLESRSLIAAALSHVASGHSKGKLSQAADFAIGVIGTITKALGIDAQKNIRAVAQAATNVFGNNSVLRDLSVAQAVLESGLTGKPSALATQYNNLYGIKGHGTAGSAVMRTREVSGAGASYYTNAGFAANHSLEDSVAQHAELMGRTRYQGVMTAKSLEEAAIAVQRAGYATDPQYAAKLIAIHRSISNYTQGLHPQSSQNSSTTLASAGHPSRRGSSQPPHATPV